MAKGERFGLIGPNGSGKTTLINCISGALANDGGSIRFDGEEISELPAYQRTRRGIARSFQIPRPFASMSVLENLIVPLEYVVHRGSLQSASPMSPAGRGPGRRRLRKSTGWWWWRTWATRNSRSGT